MATLHIRNVPEELVEALKRRAHASGRSLNAEVIQVLSEAPARPKRSIDEVIESVRRRAERIKNPPSSEDLVLGIRQARDERAEHLGNLLRGDD